jgi:hypothetical protein
MIDLFFLFVHCGSRTMGDSFSVGADYNPLLQKAE